MTNFNQNYNGEFTHFNGPQSIMQPGFAGTDPQQVRQHNAGASQGQFGGYGFGQGGQGFQQGGQGFQAMGMGASQYGGMHSIMQPGFAGTDPQQVRQHNAGSGQGQYGGFGYQQSVQGQGFPQGGQGMQSMGMGAGQFGGMHSIMQPGFAGTDAQQVRQHNAGSSQGQYGGYGYQQSGQSFQQGGQNQQFTGMGAGQFGGMHSIMQPGFAGTDVGQVRQHNAGASQGTFGYQQSGQSFPSMGMGMMGMGAGNFGGMQSVMQPGFAGTDAQQVRQQNSQSSQFGSQGYQH